METKSVDRGWNFKIARSGRKSQFPTKKVFQKVNFNTQRVVFREKQKITFFTKIQVNPA